MLFRLSARRSVGLCRTRGAWDVRLPKENHPEVSHWHFRALAALALEIEGRDPLMTLVKPCTLLRPPPSKDSIMMARTWNLLDQSSYPLLVECQKRGHLL